MPKSKYNKYVVQKLKAPFSPAVAARYAEFATKVSPDQPADIL